jgi:hypothetical protein
VKYLDPERLQSIDSVEFRTRDPYPWVNPERLLTEEGYQRLRADLPSVDRMTSSFGRQRKHGQASHDRYILEWEDELDVPQSWKDFVAELSGDVYRTFLRRMIGSDGFELLFHWHYTPHGCSVSPHCDASHKLGSHIFYFNSDDWDPAWGGETVVLDDGQRFDRRLAPEFGEFDQEIATDVLGNRSFLFIRRKNSWHGVRPLQCPADRMRHVFIVVIHRVSRVDRARRLVGLRPRRA